MAFVIQTGSSGNIGGQGHNMAYGGMSDCHLVMELDTAAHSWDPSSFHFALMGAACSDVGNHLRSTNDGGQHPYTRTVRIRHVSGVFQMWINGVLRIGPVNYDLAGRLGGQTQARVGFTAACGADWQNHLSKYLFFGVVM